MSKFAVKSAFLFAIFLFVFSLTTKNVSAAEIDVTLSNSGGWSVQAANGGSANYVDTQSQLGSGSLNFKTIPGGTAQASVERSFSSSNVPVANIKKLQYWSKTASGNNNHPVVYMSVQTSIGFDVLTFDPNNQPGGSQQNLWELQDGLASDAVWESNLRPDSGTLQAYVGFISLQNPDPQVDVTNLKFQIGATSNAVDTYFDQFEFGYNPNDPDDYTTYDFEPSVVTPTNNYEQQFYLNNDWTNPSGGATTINKTNTLGYNWGSGSPSGVPADNFSAMWEGTFNFENAKYRFTSASDKEVKVFIDGNEATPIINQTAYGTSQAFYEATAGVHTVTVKYAHGTGNAFVQYNFWKVSECYDMNADNRINALDLQLVSKHFGTYLNDVPWNVNGYLNPGDTTVNSLDLQQVASKFGRVCGVNFL